jgi:hypothetical protein
MLDDLRERLLREGVKPAIVGRYVAELSDHLEDLSEHLPRDVALRHLGSPEVLAEAMLAQPGVRSWTARAPWAVLTLGPVLGLVLACLLPTLLLFTGVRAFAADLDYGRAAEPGSWPYRILDVLFAFNEHLLPIVVGWITVAIAQRQRAGGGWLLPGILMTAFLGGGLVLKVAWHTGHPANVSFGIGFSLADPFTTVLGRSLESGVLNLVAILAPYAVLRLRAARNG